MYICRTWLKCFPPPARYRNYNPSSGPRHSVDDDFGKQLVEVVVVEGAGRAGGVESRTLMIFT